MHVEHAVMAAAEERLAAVIGDQLPDWRDAGTRRVAELARDGKLVSSQEIIHQTGRRKVDWRCAHDSHHGWPGPVLRFTYIGALASGYRATGEAGYAAAARDFVEDWIEAHPPCPDWSITAPDNSLHLAIRVNKGWGASLAALSRSAAFDAAFVERVIESIVAQLGWLSANLSPLGNFRVAQAQALVLTAIRLPFVQAAHGWRCLGVCLLDEALRRQVLPDGAHLERNPSYHHGMTCVFENVWKLAQAFPELQLTTNTEVIAAMWEYAVAVCRPNGSYNGMHDCGGFWEDYASPMADLNGRRPVMESRRAFRQRAGLPDTLPPTAQVFPVAGQALLRDGWDAEATYLTFDATQWGGAHCHLSRNSVTLHAYGRSLLVDPGALDYEMTNPAGPHGKSTAAHNTVNLNGWNQSHNNPDYTRYYHGQGLDAVISRYAGGYWPGPFGWWFFEGRGAGLAARHVRLLLWVHDRFAVVIDSLIRWDERTHAPDRLHCEPSLEINWQFSPGPLQVENPGAAVAGDPGGMLKVQTGHADANLLLLMPLAMPGMQAQVYEGSREPFRGWVVGRTDDHGRLVPAMDKRGFIVPAPQVCVRAAPMQGYDACLVTVLVPFRGRRAPEVRVSRCVPPDSIRPGQLCLHWPDGSSETIVWTAELDRMIGTFGGIFCDGAAVAIRQEAPDGPSRACIIDGTVCAPVAGGTAAMQAIPVPCVACQSHA